MKGDIITHKGTSISPSLGGHTARGAPNTLIIKQHMLVIGHGGRQRGATERPLALIPILGAAATSKSQKCQGGLLLQSERLRNLGWKAL